MAAKRKVSNPLALVALALLMERPMHPYELATTMKERHQQESIKLNFGSLYTVVDALQREGFIEPVETVREGRRPERTVYAVTQAGREELHDWLSDLLRRPVKEYTHFAAGLAIMGVLTLDEVVALLREREQHLTEEITWCRETLDRVVVEHEIPRLFVIETEFGQALREAELEWVRKLVQALEDRSIEGARWWAARPPLDEQPLDVEMFREQIRKERRQ